MVGKRRYAEHIARVRDGGPSATHPPRADKAWHLAPLLEGPSLVTSLIVGPARLLLPKTSVA